MCSKIQIHALLVLLFLQSSLAKVVSHDPNDAHFYLYSDRGNFKNKQEIVFRNDSSLSASMLAPLQYTVIMTHGLIGKGLSNIMEMIKDEYLSSNIGGNFIIFDWSKLSTLNSTKIIDIGLGYVEVVGNVPVVAKRLAEFIEWLQEQGAISLHDVHLVGHSLGAHVSGQAGKKLISYYGGKKLERITGLDPAGPLFFPPSNARNIQRTDAHFVQIIHTNAGELGDITIDGHADFYVNGGTNQPNTDCGGEGGLPGGCSHKYAVEIFAKSINKNFTGCPCAPFSTNWRTPCNTTEQLLGENCRSTARGPYCVKAGYPL